MEKKNQARENVMQSETPSKKNMQTLILMTDYWRSGCGVVLVFFFSRHRLQFC